MTANKDLQLYVGLWLPGSSYEHMCGIAAEFVCPFWEYQCFGSHFSPTASKCNNFSFPLILHLLWLFVIFLRYLEIYIYTLALMIMFQMLQNSWLFTITFHKCWWGPRRGLWGPAVGAQDQEQGTHETKNECSRPFEKAQHQHTDLGICREPGSAP